MSASLTSALDQKLGAGNYSTFTFSPMELSQFLQFSATFGNVFFLNVGNQTVQLNLQPSTITAPGAKMVSDDDGVFILPDMESDGVYRGTVNTDSTLLAGFIITNDDFSGYFQVPGDTWSITSVDNLLDTPGSNPFLFVKLKSGNMGSDLCATTNTSSSPTSEPPATERATCELFFEIAYDVDFTTFQDVFDRVKPTLPLGTPDSDVKTATIEKINSDLKAVTMEVEAIYMKTDAKMKFFITTINVRTTANAYPYGTDLPHGDLWSNAANQWKSSPLDCFYYDAVCVILNDGFGANGYVAPSGIDKICGTQIGGSCPQLNPFSIVRFKRGTFELAGIVAHELGHNFGLGHTICDPLIGSPDCTLMSSCPECPVGSHNFNNHGKIVIGKRCDPNFKVCKNQNSVEYPANSCLLDIPPVDLNFNLTLIGDQALSIPANKVFCPNEVFTAKFYNGYNPSLPIVWELGPNLQYTANQPSNLLSKNIQVSTTAPCCSKAETWIKITFTYNCGQVTYQAKIRLGSSFGLEGIYQAPVPPYLHTLATFNTVPSGDYQVTLENPTPVYTWTQTIGNQTITLPYATNKLWFWLGNGYLSFTASAPGECGTLTRSIVFHKNGSWLVKPNNPTNVLLSPNPVSTWLEINLASEFGEAAELLEINIFNQLGACVKTIASGLNENSARLDVSNLSAGPYSLLLTTDGGSKTAKFIKL